MDEFRIAVRPGTDADTAYVSRTWLKSFDCKVPHRGVVAGILSRAAVTVAHPDGDPETILGFLVAEAGAVHWLYVRANWRGNGIARALTAGLSGGVFTHWSTAGARLGQRLGMVYYPYLVEVSV